MKYDSFIKIVAILFILIGCEKSNKIEQKPEDDDAVNAEKLIQKIDSLEEDIRRKSDTLKKIKVFDNIYFRSNNNHFKEDYFIDDIPFQLVSSSYHKDLLYDFELRTLYLPGIDYEFKKETIDRIISIIKVKYKNPKKINKFLASEPRDFLSDVNEDNSKPKDNNNLHIEYEWIKDDIRIRLGYKIIYEKTNRNFNKLFVPIIYFRDLKIAQEMKNENEKNDRQNLKKDANKF